MGTIKEKTVFVTEDGKEHSTLQDAQDWDFRNTLVEDIVKNSMESLRDAGQIVDWLLSNYNITSKE
jgi:hypothetical protein